jgi:hypothetical protein
MNETRETDFGFVLRTAAAWIERMRGEADDEDVAWMVAELRKLESETLPQLRSERDALKADKERLDWLEAKAQRHCCQSWSNRHEFNEHSLSWRGPYGTDFTGANVRQAIDAAMSS